MPTRRSNYSSRHDQGIRHSTYGGTPYAFVLIALSILCFTAAFIQNGSAGKTQSFTFNPEDDGQTATLQVENPNTVYAVSVSQSASGLAENRDWSDVSVIVRSKDGKQLLSFGGDFWRASGYDEGRWSETKNRYRMKLTFPLRGEYQVAIEGSSSLGTYKKPVKVEFDPRRGSPLPLLLLGIPALIAGVIIGFISNQRIVAEKLAEWS